MMSKRGPMRGNHEEAVFSLPQVIKTEIGSFWLCKLFEVQRSSPLSMMMIHTVTLPLTSAILRMSDL